MPSAKSLLITARTDTFSTVILQSIYDSDLTFKLPRKRDPGPDDFLFQFLCNVLKNRAIRYSEDDNRRFNYIKRNAKFIQGRCGYDSWGACVEEVCRFVVMDEIYRLPEQLDPVGNFYSIRYEDSMRNRFKMSAWIGDFDYFKTFATRCDLDIAERDLYTEAVGAAAYKNHTKILEYLLDLSPSGNCIRAALQRGVERGGHLGILDIIKNRYPNSFNEESLLAASLLVSARSGRIKVVQYILDLPARSKESRANLISRALLQGCEGGHTDIVEFLLQCIDSEELGSMVTSYGSCLCVAARRGNADVMMLLISAGDAKRLSNVFHRLGYLEELDVHNDPLAEAAKFGHVPIVRLLLDKSISTGDYAHKQGVKQALINALAHEQYAVIELLLRMTGRVGIEVVGEKALETAILANTYASSMVRLLRDKGCNFQKTLRENPRLLDIARNRDDQELLVLLEDTRGL